MHGLLTYNVPLPCILCFVNAREIKVDMTSDSADKNEIMTLAMYVHLFPYVSLKYCMGQLKQVKHLQNVQARMKAHSKMCLNVSIKRSYFRRIC